MDNQSISTIADSSDVPVESSEEITSNEKGDFQRYMRENPKAECLIGIRGSWYDVTNFRDHHPGGRLLLERSHGKDVTELFEAFHVRNTLKGWKPVGSYSKRSSEPVQIFEDLHKLLKEKGFFECSYSFYVQKFIITITLFILSALILHIYTASSWVIVVLSALSMGLAWQQCGFLMHDLMHSEFTHNRKIDAWLAYLFGSIFLGIGAYWWRDEHFEHHAYTNVIEKTTQTICDPQMQEDVWAQDPKLFEFYMLHPTSRISWMNTALYHLQLVQHITFLPFCVLAGRFAIIINGLYKERRWYEVVAHGIHTCLISAFLYYLIPGSIWYRVLFYVVAAIYEGIIHVQLLISHYSRPWYHLEDVCTQKLNWYQLQIVANCNIDNPWWLDWFYGGLNFHIEHHLYPLMPRHRLREASQFVRKACQNSHYEYNSEALFPAICTLLSRLRQVSYQHQQYYRKIHTKSQ